VASGTAIKIVGSGFITPETLVLSGTGVANRGAVYNKANKNTLSGAISFGADASFYSDGTSASDSLIISGTINTGTLAPPITKSGLILNLDAGNSASYPGTASGVTNTWYDLTSNQNNGTLTSFPASGFYSTLGGGSLTFDGLNNYVLVKSGVYFNGDFTIQSWVYPTLVQNWSRVLDFGNGAGSNNILLGSSYGTSGKPGFYVEGSQFEANTTLPLNQWSQLSATVSGTTATIYLNGNSIGSSTVTRPVNVTRTLNYIGKSNWGSGDPNFKGNISNLQIYKKSMDLAPWRSNAEFTRVSQWSIPFYWATTFIFTKNNIMELFFNLVAYIKANWTYFRTLYCITAGAYRNDYAFSIAIHIMNGKTNGEFATDLPGTMTYSTDKDLLITLENDRLQFLIEKENYIGQYTLAKTQGIDVHVMNKHSLCRFIDGGSGV
jgi:hypothetical protein